MDFPATRERIHRHTDVSSRRILSDRSDETETVDDGVVTHCGEGVDTDAAAGGIRRSTLDVCPRQPKVVSIDQNARKQSQRGVSNDPRCWCSPRERVEKRRLEEQHVDKHDAGKADAGRLQRAERGGNFRKLEVVVRE